MHDVVRDGFVDFTSPLEGICPFMYLDVKGLVTCAIGNLIDDSPNAAPWMPALSLPWLLVQGVPAAQHEVIAEWQRIKAMQSMELAGGGAFKRVAQLHLDEVGVLQAVHGKLDQMDQYLARRFPEWESWPADAQLATLSVSWACGPAFNFPHLEAALKAQDWYCAIAECGISEVGNPGIKPRNQANRVLYSNASMAEDPSVLYWPRDLSQEAPQ